MTIEFKIFELHNFEIFKYTVFIITIELNKRKFSLIWLSHILEIIIYHVKIINTISVMFDT